MAPSSEHSSEHGEHPLYKLTINEKHYTTDDPVLTGRQLLEKAGKTPIEEHLVYWLGPNNILEDIGLEETIDLRKPGTENFLTFKSDRSFRFDIDGKREDWGAPLISEGNLLKLASVGPRYRVWLERKSEPDRLLAKGELVDLTGAGVERFYTRPDLDVTVVNEENGDEFVLEGRPETRLETLFSKMYVELGVDRRPDDRLRCESNGSDVFSHAHLTLEQYVKGGYCACLTWLFAGGTGGAGCR
jgi:hypothetical protein